MKSKDRADSIYEGKTKNPNTEPWLTYRELLFVGAALAQSYSKWK